MSHRAKWTKAPRDTSPKGSGPAGGQLDSPVDAERIRAFARRLLAVVPKVQGDTASIQFASDELTAVATELFSLLSDPKNPNGLEAGGFDWETSVPLAEAVASIGGLASLLMFSTLDPGPGRTLNLRLALYLSAVAAEKVAAVRDGGGR